MEEKEGETPSLARLIRSLLLLCPKAGFRVCAAFFGALPGRPLRGRLPVGIRRNPWDWLQREEGARTLGRPTPWTASRQPGV